MLAPFASKSFTRAELPYFDRVSERKNRAGRTTYSHCYIKRRIAMLIASIDVCTTLDEQLCRLVVLVLAKKVGSARPLDQTQKQQEHTIVARKSGVAFPQPPTSPLAESMFAPRSSKSATTAVWPCRAAICRGVHLSNPFAAHSSTAAPWSSSFRARFASPRTAATNNRMCRSPLIELERQKVQERKQSQS